MIARKDPVSGMEKLVLDDEGDDEEQDESKTKALTAEERQAKAQKEREEKLKKYDEVRERLFGTSSPAPPADVIESPSPSRVKSLGERARGKGRDSASRDTRPGTSTLAKAGKQLFDPNYVPKPDSTYLKKQETQNSRSSTPVEDQIIRQPHGPDQSGRGGNGFANRDRKSP